MRRILGFMLLCMAFGGLLLFALNHFFPPCVDHPTPTETAFGCPR